MTSHNATCNAHDVIWKQISWQHQRWTCYRVQYHNVAWCSIYECLFELSSTTNILRCHLVHNKNTSPPTIPEMYVSLACLDRDMFRSKYARRVRPWMFSMLCRWRHWGRGTYLQPLKRHTCGTSLSTWLPMPELHTSLETERTITGKTYLDMLANWLMPQINEYSDDYIFQQDGCPAQFS